ncbi:winged helix-turn-helix domain-containing protein [Pleionea sp. CnH1-48]|uniref:winged helix-turn-helix domain-containing protein n=1 Tax=Pleionea sp. CnH1-48 TaxID=2954494 RepID=UPI0020976973|nr:winged helix-turn-helix domain-containing protein [Pleionea sp. CnH1-48]MCO7224391.1 winged helix-turn-helix domain-containing protein [Pleionea sp. CnH1-48]
MQEKTKFYIDDIQIDLSCSVLINGEQQTHIEPKVLKVFSLLAQRQNEVVTHQELMDHVWKGTEVAPNALQRCIAILRKELGDDAKSPKVIATHPRIGYRLLKEVRWHTPSTKQETLDLGEIRANVNPRSFYQWPWLALLASIILLVVIVVAMPWQNSPAHSSSLKRQYSQITPLTQTDAHESHTLFSPDAKYLIFNRYAGSCKNHIWAKHLESGKETQLTSEPGEYGAVSFTRDGRELVFAANYQCAQQAQLVVQNKTDAQMCWSLATLDFSVSLTEPQTPRFRYQCQADRLLTPKALTNHQYAFLQLAAGQIHLMHYNDLNKELKSLYSSETQYLYHFDYDPKHKRFAVFSRDKDFNNILELLDEQGNLYRRQRLKLPAEFSRYELFRAKFEPQGEYLLSVNHGRLYQVALNGQLQPIQTPMTNLVSVAQSPTGNSLLAVQGKKDIDVVELTLGQQASVKDKSDLNSVSLPFASFARSAAQERFALYQPEGERVAFISDRSGSDQLWIWHDGKATQLSFEINQNTIQSYSWSPDGRLLAWASGDRLVITDLTGKIRTFNTDKPIYSILSWYKENQFLVSLNDPYPGGLYHLDIEAATLDSLGINHVDKAWVTENALIFSNTSGDVFRLPFESKLPLNDNESKALRLPNLNSKAMVVTTDFIYSVDSNSLMLNQYNLQGELIQPIMQLKGTAWKLTDFRGRQLLLSQFVAIHHDIVVLK